MSSGQRILTVAAFFLYIVVASCIGGLLAGCIQAVDPESVKDADLICEPTCLEGWVFAWCDEGHFHTAADIGGGTVTATGAKLICPLKCRIVPKKAETSSVAGG